MFLRRAEVDVPPLAKRLLHASFVLSFLLAFFALHARIATGLHAPPRTELYRDPVVLRLGIPVEVGESLILVCAVAYLFSTAGALLMLRRHASLGVSPSWLR